MFDSQSGYKNGFIERGRDGMVEQCFSRLLHRHLSHTIGFWLAKLAKYTSDGGRMDRNSLYRTSELRLFISEPKMTVHQVASIATRLELSVVRSDLPTALTAASHNAASRTCGVALSGSNSMSTLLVSHGHGSLPGLKIAKRSIGDRASKVVFGRLIPHADLDGESI